MQYILGDYWQKWRKNESFRFSQLFEKFPHVKNYLVLSVECIERFAGDPIKKLEGRKGVFRSPIFEFYAPQNFFLINLLKLGQFKDAGEGGGHSKLQQRRIAF